MLVRARKLRKRSLPASPGGGSTALPTGRRRTRHQVTLYAETVKKLAARSAAARALGCRTSLSSEIDRAVDEAEGNLRTARHEFRGVLNPMRVQLGFIKSELLSGRPISVADLQPIEKMVEMMAARLEPPAATPG